MRTPAEYKTQSEREIVEFGGKICDWLPHIELTEPRQVDEVRRRALVLNAMMQIGMNAPTQIIKRWLQENGVFNDLSPVELALVNTPNDELPAQEIANLKWYIEALWATLWAGSMIDAIPFDEIANGYTVTDLCPDLRINEDGSKFTDFQLRPHEELVQARDLHYRLHWWTRDGTLNGYDTGEVRIDVIMERRKALEWICDSSVDWDDVDMST